MKLRLPHKFQAALMAALASVSFTTLSTGTLTVAAGAAFLAGQQAQANYQEKIITSSVTIEGNAYSAENGVIVVKGDNSDSTALDLGLEEGVTAEYTFLTSTNKDGGTSQGRYKVDAGAATRMANYGTIILAQGMAADSNYRGGEIFVNSGVTITNNLILGTFGYSESNDWAGTIRMGGNNTFSGKVDIVQDTTLVMGGNATFTGSVNGAGKKLKLNKTSTLTFAGDLTLNTLDAASASVVFSGSHVVISGTGTDQGIHQAGATITVGGGAGTTLMELGRLEMGDAQNSSSSLNVRNGATLKITGSNNGTGYKAASFVLGEWSTATTATIEGTVLSKDADVRAGDKGGTINIAATGTLAAKGILNTKSDGRFTVNVNGGRLVLGSDGNAGQSLNLNIGATLGLYAASANITGPTALNGLVTFDTQMYAFAADGNSVGHATSGTTAINVTGNATIAGGAHLSVVGGGSVSFTGSSINIAGRLATDGAVTIGGGSSTVTLAGTIANSGSLTLAGALTLPSAGVYEIFGTPAEGDFDGTGEYAGSGYRRGNNTQYYLVHGADSSSVTTNFTSVTGGSIVQDAGTAGKDVIIKLAEASESDKTYYVNTNVNYGSVMADATSIVVTPTGTLSIGGNDAANLLNTKITGSGTVVINASTSLPAGTSAAPYTTLATGTLRVAANTTLTVGTDKNSHYYDLSSFSAVELGDGALIRLKQRPGLVLNNVSVASGTAHIGKNDSDDTYDKDIDAATLRGTTLVNGELQMGTNWKWQMSVDKLKGSGTLVARGSNETHRLIINGFDGTFGTLKYTGNNTEIYVKGSGTITNLDNTGSSNSLKLDNGVTLEVLNTAKANTLDGAGTIVVDATKTWSLGAANTWTGTLRLHGNKNGSIGNFVGNANSTVELTDLNGWTSNWDGTITQNIKLTNGTTGYAWQNGAYGGSANQTTPTATFTGTWSGDGMFKVVSAQGDRSMNYTYTGDVSRWTGEFNKDGKQTTILTFSQNANVVNAVISKASGAATFTVAAATDVVFNKAVTADAFNLSDGKTATFNAAAKLGNATATGGAILQGQNGALELAGLTKSGDGTLTLNGFSKLGSTITLSGGSLVFGAGEYDLSSMPVTHNAVYSAGDHGYLTVTDKVQLVSTGTGVSVAEGAVFKYVSAEGTSTATAVAADGSVTLGYSSGDTYILNNNTSMDLAAEVALKPALTVLVQGGTGTINLADGTASTLQALEVESGSTATLSGTGKMALASFTGDGTLANNAHLQLGGDRASSFAGKLTGTGILEKVGSGALTITGANNGFTGDLIISEGSVKMGTTTSLGKWDNNRTIRVDAGGTLDYNGVEADATGYKVTLNGGTLANTGTGKDNNKRQVVTQLVLTDNSYINAASKMGIIGGGYAATSIDMGGFTLEKTGASTLYLTNTTISNGGTIKVSQGSVEFNVGAGASQLGSLGANLELAGGSIGGNKIKLANDITISATAAASAETSTGLAVDMNGHTLTLDVADGKTLTLSGAFTNGGTFVKTGTGTASLTGTPTVSRTIQVDGGALNFNNGTVTLSESLVGFESTGGYIDWQGVSGQDGFAGSMDYIIFKTTGEGTTNITSVVHGGATHELTDGKYHVDSEVDYTTYYIRTADAAPLDIAATLTAHPELATVDMAAAGTVAVNSAATLPTLNIQDGLTGTVDGTAALTLNTLSLGNGSTLALGGTATVNASAINGTANLDLGAGTNFNYTRGSKLTMGNGQTIITTGAGSFNLTDQVIELQGAALDFGSSTNLKEVDTRGASTVTLRSGTHTWEKLGMGQDQASNSTLDVQSGATLHITGTLSSDSQPNRFKGSFLLSHWGGTNTVNVSGKLISEAVISSWDGTPTITVKSGGELELRQGLTRNYSVDGGESRDQAANKITLTVEEGGTLTVGATPNGDNLSHAGLAVTMQSGTTLGGYFGTANDVTVYQNITGPASGTLTFHADGAGHTLTLQGSLSGDAALVKTGSGAFMLSNGYVLNHKIDLRGGSIGFSGTYDLSSIEHTAGEVTYHGGAVEGTNGFAAANTELQLVTMADGTSIGDTSNAHFIIDELTATLDADGYARTSGTPDFTVFHVLTGQENVSQGRLNDHDPIYSLADGAKLVVDGDVAVGKLTRETGSTGTASVEISGGNTLSVDSTNNRLSISGSGVYELNGTTSLGGALEDSWTGTVRIVDAAATFLDFTQYVKGISTLELKGFSGWNENWYQGADGKGLNPENIKLTNGSNGYAWEFTGSTTGNGNYITFSGNWSGDGKLLAKSNKLSYRFTGDISQWNGTFQAGNGDFSVVFSGNATAVNAAIDRNGNTLNVEVGNGTDAFATTFGNTVNASKLEIKNGASATFNKAVTLAGDLTMDGTVDAQSHAVFKEGGSVDVIDLSHGGNAHGTVTVAAGKNLTYGSSFWAANNNRLILEAGATVQQTNNAPAIIKGLEGSGYVSSSANEAFGLDKSCYTLSNVEATINTASENVQLHFDNGKLVTAQNITLKDVTSTFCGMDINGGTTTVGSNVAEDTTVQLGAVALSGGALALAQHVTGSVSGISVAGTSSITGDKLDMGTSGPIALGNDSAFTLAVGAVDLTHMAAEGDEEHSFIGGSDGQNLNGFETLISNVRLFTYGEGATLEITGTPTFNRSAAKGSLVTEGDNKGLVQFAGTTYTAFFLNVEGVEENLLNAQETAIREGGTGLTDVYLNAGILDTTDSEMLIAMHVNSGEGTVYVKGDAASIITLDGSGTLSVASGTNLNGTNLNIAAGTTLTLEGGAAISYGHITNHGTLGIGEGTTVSTGAFTISGDTFNTTGAGTLVSSGKLTVDGGTVNLGSNAQFSDIDLGNGTLNISAGTTTVDGTVKLGYDDGKASGTLNVAQGATLTAQNVSSPWGYSSMTVAGTINATGQFAITTGEQVRYVSGSGTINTGKLVVGNVTTKAVFSGGLAINIGNGGIGGDNYATRPLELHDVTVGVLGDSDGWAAANAITLADTTTGTTFNIGTGKAVTLNGAISGSGKLVKEGAGILELTSVNNYGGAFTVNAGKLLITTDALPGTLRATGVGELDLRVNQGGQDVDLKTVSAANLHLVADSTHNSRFNYKNNTSNLNGVDHLYFDGGQLWLNNKDMTGDNKFTGNVTFNTTTYSEGNAFGGAAIRVNTNGTFSGAVNVAENTKIAWGANKTVEFSGTVTGDGDLNLASYNNNTGTFKVSGTATGYTGAITSDSHITLNVANGGSLNVATGSNLAGAVAVDGTMSVTGDSTISGAVSGSGTINVNAGTLELTGASTFAGTTNVKQGTLVLGNAYTTNTITVASGAGITFANGATITANSMTLTNGAMLDFSDYKGSVGSEIHVVTTTAGVTGFGDAAITGPAAPRGMQATVAQKENDIVLTFQAKDDATMHLYVLTGQSNSLGAVKDSPLNATMLAAYQSEGLLWNGNMNKDSGVRFETDPTWQIVAPQKPDGSGYNNNPCMGPEYGFSYIMANKDWGAQLLGEDGTLAVVKGSLDGGGNGYWLQNANAYQSLLGSVKESIQDAVALGYSNISLDGLMYLQGESNSANEASQAATRFTDFIGYLKSDLQSWLTENPELTGITLSFDGNTVTGEPRLGSDARQTTEGQFLELATSEGMLNADKNGKGHVLTNDLAVTNCDGLNVHYTGNAQLTIGARYAYAFAVQKGIDVGAVRGQDDSKTLDQAGAWWMERLPGENEVATWDISSVSTVNDIADGATLTVGGIKIDEVYRNGATDKGQGSIAINGGAISLGAGGINLVGGNLSITSGVTVRESQTWQAADGHKLAVNGTTTISGNAKLTMKDGLYLTFGAITGTGNLEIGTVTFDMNLDYMLANGLGKYRTSTEEVAENGFFMGGLDLVKLTGETSAITFTHEGGVGNITKAGDLADYTLQLSDDKKALQLLGLHLDEETYFTRKGEVTYTDTDTAQYGIYTAKQVMLSGSVDQPATLKLASALKEGVTIQASGLGGTVNIVDGVTLAAASVNAAGGPVALAGEGTFALSGTATLPTNVTLADAANWHGTVKIANTSGASGYDIKLNALGNENSAVEFENVTAYLNTASTTYTPNIRLTGEGLNIDAGSTDGVYTFNGDVTGSGTLNLSLSRGSDRHTYVFAGDVKDWYGELLAPTGGKTLTVKFTGEADTVNAAIKKTGGTLNLVADADTTFNAALTGLNSLTVNGSKSASVLGGIGTNATTLNDGSSLTIGGTANSTLGTVTLNNNTALTIGGSGTVTASNVKVGDQCAATITLGNDFSIEQLDTIAALNTLTIASEDGMTKTLTTGKLGFDNVSTVISLQNVNMVVTGAATAGVLDAHNNNKGTMTVGANATLDLRGTTQWNTSDTKNVDLVVKDGGAVSVSGGTENKLRTVELGTGSTNASLSFGAETHTAIANTNVAAGAHATVNGDANAVDFGNVNVGANAEMNVMNMGEAATVSVSDVTIGANATMGAYQGTELSSIQEADLVIASGKTLTAAGEGATLNANLVMEAGSKLDVSGTGGAGLIMGSTVTLNQGNLLTVGGSTDVDSYLRSYFGGDTSKLYTLYSGTEIDPLELYIGGQKVENDITFTDWTRYDMDASQIYTNLQAKTYYLVYDGSNVGMVAIGLIPEPTTSTLSLLALAALAARRRRK